MLNRAGWSAALAVLLTAGGAAFYFLNGVVLKDRRELFPLESQDLSGPRQDFLDMAWVARSAVPWGELSGPPGTRFQWKAGQPGVAQVTLSEPTGRTRLPALAAPAGSVYEWAGVLPSSASFEFRTGVLAGGASFHFTVDLMDSAGQNHPLFSETEFVPPLKSSSRWTDRLHLPFQAFTNEREPLAGRWFPARVDLSPWSGRSVRILLRVEAPGHSVTANASRGEIVWSESIGEIENLRHGHPAREPVHGLESPAASLPPPPLAFWGGPRIWFPAPARPPVKRGGQRPPPGTPVVLAVMETTPPGAVLEGVPSPLGDFIRESVFFPQFYTSDVRPVEALKHLLFAPPLFTAPGAVPSPLSAWPRVLGENRYPSYAVGAFSDEMMAALSDAGIDEIHQLPHDGYDPFLTATRAADWARDRGRGPLLVIAFFRDLPQFRWPPVRFWAFSLRRFPRSAAQWFHLRWAADGAYLEEAVGRLVESLNRGSEAFLVGAVSLRGEETEPVPVGWPGTGRRGKIFIHERGWGMRESEIRTLFALRQGARWEPALCRSPGQIPDVGPTLLKALELPIPASAGRAWDAGAAARSGDSSGRWGVRSPWAKALIVDGRYKYIRHGPSSARSIPSGGGGSVPVQIDFPAEELFDLWEDPGEKKNLTRSRRHLLARMRDVLGEVDPDPVEVRLGFLNPAGARVEGAVTCSAGTITAAWGTVPISRAGSYEFSFSTTAASGTVAFRTWPPESSYSMRFLVDQRPLPSGKFLVSRWGLPLFESVRNEWRDKTEFGWMDGWAPPAASTGTVASLGRVR